MSDGVSRLRSAEVYAVLREEITDGVITPGSPLVEDEIAQRLGVSRTPVRESIQRLAADGLVVSRRRRWIVHAYSAAEITEIYEVRAGLESHAARLAALRATDEKLAEIEAQRTEMTNEDLLLLPERAKANDHFHDLISGAAGSARMMRAIRDHRLFHFNRGLAKLYNQDEVRISSRQHAQLIDAVTARDAGTAGEIARVHVEFSLGLVLKKLY
ncbi:GntR family transcriptional regulator [Actinoplanes couchii]|uniref:GntR family transcriptional regulator n=1 Tax=Actinoplanes couchii TaxID=403638 RepID=A0ABQ3X8D5_9ACTN|nr:GntR family transcriptional regulator [Actinoplanes couchii]MDR6320212.1 DNA-binding GntR family transcriptional regulator [Actinoplanes couchii]GID54773.1 GntR family transcriptional regulator [Actinoplanes couchii]